MSEQAEFGQASPLSEWKPATPAVTGDEIEQLVHSHPAVAIHFWAPWNGTDKLMDRHLVAVRQLFEDRIHFVCCNTDLPENVSLCQRCRIAMVPAVGLFVNAKAKRSIYGLMTPEKLAAEFDARLVAGDEPRPKWWEFWKRGSD